MVEEHRINIMDEQPSVKPVEEQTDTETMVEYASFVERFVALLVDYGVIFIPLQLVALLILKLMPSLVTIENFTLLIAGINVLFILYETIFSSGDRVTLGKSLVGIAVMNVEASGPIPLWRAFLRAVGYYVSAALLGCGFLWAFVDDRHRALHDMMGGSVVVRVRKRATAEKMIVHVVGAVLLVVFGYVLYSHVWGGTDWRDKVKINQARDFLVNIGLLEETHKRLYGAYTPDYLRLVLLSGDPVQFQRDMRKVLSNKGFRIGVKGDTYKIMARAKDKNKTPVVYERP